MISITVPAWPVRSVIMTKVVHLSALKPAITHHATWMVLVCHVRMDIMAGNVSCLAQDDVRMTFVILLRGLAQPAVAVTTGSIAIKIVQKGALIRYVTFTAVCAHTVRQV